MSHISSLLLHNCTKLTKQSSLAKSYSHFLSNILYFLIKSDICEEVKNDAIFFTHSVGKVRVPLPWHFSSGDPTCPLRADLPDSSTSHALVHITAWSHNIFQDRSIFKNQDIFLFSHDTTRLLQVTGPNYS